jgi:hypothetical protein
MDFLNTVQNVGSGLWGIVVGIFTSPMPMWQTVVGLLGLACGLVALRYTWRGVKTTGGGLLNLGKNIGGGALRGTGGLLSRISLGGKVQPLIGSTLMLAGLAGSGVGFSEWWTSTGPDFASIEKAKQLCTTTSETTNKEGSVTVTQNLDQSMFATMMEDIKSGRVKGAEINSQRLPRSVAFGTFLASLGLAAAGLTCAARGLQPPTVIKKV